MGLMGIVNAPVYKAEPIFKGVGNDKNYMDQYVTTTQSDEVHYYELNWTKIIRTQQMIFQRNISQCSTGNFYLHFDQAGNVYIW